MYVVCTQGGGQGNSAPLDFTLHAYFSLYTLVCMYIDYFGEKKDEKR